MSFNPMDCRLAMQLVPKRLPFRSSWITHIPFAYALIELARPRSLVELGTHHGASYLAFCQAIAGLNLNTKCTAVDTWQGDPHAGFYGAEVLQQLCDAHDREGYSAFSTLMQSTFDEAVARFEDGSIDILHIDGLHTYDAVKHDFESWLPKVNAQQGVILFHDSRVHSADFGVWKLWEELAAKYRNFELHDGPGLGVLLVGTNPPPKLANFFDAAARQPDDLRIFFTAMAQSVVRLQASRALVRAANSVIAGVNDYRRGNGVAVSPTPALAQMFADPESTAKMMLEAVEAIVHEKSA